MKEFTMRPTSHASIKTTLIISCAALLACTSGYVRSELPDVIYGMWLIESIIPTNSIQGPTASQQAKLVGSTMEFEVDSMKSCWSQAPIMSYEVRKIDSSEFLTENKIHLESIGIYQNTVYEIILNNRQAGTCFEDFPLPGQVLLVRDKDELIVVFEGVYYLARRAKWDRKQGSEWSDPDFSDSGPRAHTLGD